MAVHKCAAAFGSRVWCFFVCFLVCVFKLSTGSQHPCGHSETCRVSVDCHRVYQAAQAEKGQEAKACCRVGLLTRLRKQPLKPQLSSIFLSNARSITHKADDMELLIAANKSVCDCCVIIVTGTWLHLAISDTAV